MIISALKEHFKSLEYNQLYAISNDKGFRIGLERETSFKAFADINSARKEILGYDDNEVLKINKYLSENRELFNNQDNYNFNSYDSSDIIDIDEICKIQINDIDLLDIDDNILTVEVKINASILGDFLLFDPYDSIYDREDNVYCYIVQRKAKQIDIISESIFVSLRKNNNDEITKLEFIDHNNIDLLKYIHTMDIEYEY